MAVYCVKVIRNASYCYFQSKILPEIKTFNRDWNWKVSDSNPKKGFKETSIYCCFPPAYPISIPSGTGAHPGMICTEGKETYWSSH